MINSKKKYPQQQFKPLRIRRPDLIQKNAFHAKTEFFPVYQKCSATMYYDVFQSDWNGFYQIQAGQVAYDAEFRVRHSSGSVIIIVQHFIGVLVVL